MDISMDIFIQLITSEAGKKKPTNKNDIQDHWMLLSAQSDIDILCEAAIFTRKPLVED